MDTIGMIAALCLAPCLIVTADDPYVVVWDSPSADSSGSMPLGNGDVGINLWVEENGDLVFYLSKTDAWSENGRLLKLGRVRVSLTPGLVKPGQPFRMTLDAHEGVARVVSGSDGSALRIHVWVDANYPFVRVEVEGDQPFEMAVAFETWRTEERPLLDVERDSAYGLTESGQPITVHPDTVIPDRTGSVAWFHRNEQSIWADTLTWQGVSSFIPDGVDPLLNRTFGGVIRGRNLVSVDPAHLRSSAPAATQAFAVYVLNAVTPTPQAWIEQAERLVDEDTSDWRAAYDAHTKWWRAFWDRSWIRLSSAENAAAVANVDRGYALQRYISACVGRGGSPIKFNGSIFTVDAVQKGVTLDADYRQWGGPYWFQNTRLAYWPMLASGDFEMMEPLFRMYLDALPFAQARTRTYFGHGGAFFPETMYFWGAYANDNYGWKREGLDIGVTENTYIRYYYDGALELLLLMLQFENYTGDPAFVQERLLPLATPVIEFYEEHYPRGEDGKLRIAPSQALETWQKANDPAPPIAGLRRVLTDLLALPDSTVAADLREAWVQLREDLPAIPVRQAEDGAVLSPAAEILEEARNSENAELYAVYPYGLYGVGRPDLDLARRTYEQRPYKGHNGWRQDEIQAACLGLAREARDGLLARFAMKHEGSRFPAFWGPNFDWIPDQDHGCSGMMALQSMLLQCDGKRMFLFPAWPKEWDVDFKLHAPFQTTLQGKYSGGKLVELTVMPESRRADVSILDPQ